MSQDKLRDRLVEVARQRRAREAADVGRGGLGEALEPLDQAAKDRITARVMSELGASPGAKVIPFRRRLWAATAVAATAIAATLVLFLWPDRRAPLPTYETTFAGEALVRGAEPAEKARVGPGSVLTIAARPKQPVRGPLEVAAFLVRGDVVRSWSAPLQVSPEGALRISGPAEKLLPPEPGPWTAVIVISRAGRPRTDAQDALRLSRGEPPADPEAQVIQVRFEQTGP